MKKQIIKRKLKKLTREKVESFLLSSIRFIFDSPGHAQIKEVPGLEGYVYVGIATYEPPRGSGGGYDEAEVVWKEGKTIKSESLYEYKIPSERAKQLFIEKVELKKNFIHVTLALKNEHGKTPIRRKVQIVPE